MKLSHLKTTATGVLFCGALAAAQGQTIVENFEYASSDPNAQAGGNIYQGTTATLAIGSGTGANASEGTYSLRADVDFNGTAFDNVNIERFLTAPYVLSSPIPAASLSSSFAVRIDVKGDPAFGGTFGTNLFVYLFDADGDIFRFINFTDPALASSTYSTDHAVGYFDNSTVVNGTLEQVNAVQILFQDADGDTMPAAASIYVDKLVFEEVTPASGLQIDDFESAVDNTAAAANWAVGTDPSVTLTPVSGSGADANEGAYALGLNLAMGGSAFETGFVRRTLGAPVTLSQAYSVAGPSGQNIADLSVTLDIKGAAAFGADTNLWIRLNEADGDIWRYINFNDATLGSTSYVAGHAAGVGLIDRDGASTGDGNFTAITSYDILIQNPVATAKSGIIYVDDFRIEEPTGPPTTGLTYTIPVIPAVQAPNVTDNVFDAIYSNSGAHPVIEGDDWKDYAQAGTDPGAGISTNSDATAAAGIFATSKAYLVSDGQFIYFGMKVWDPNTALMTADTGNETFTKWNVESIEVAFSALSGGAGTSTAFKVAMDGFSQIDDMMPDGNVLVNTVALTNNNSYAIDANTWALEWKVDINELVTLSQTNLATPLPAPSAGNWFGHIGYQSPGARSVISPLYAAGHANGFGNFTVEFDLSNIAQATAVTDWSMY